LSDISQKKCYNDDDVFFGKYMQYCIEIYRIADFQTFKIRWSSDNLQATNVALSAD